MIMETIGEKILEIRKRKGLTQENLADLAKINLRTLQRIEKGDTEPQSNTLKSLCNVLEINFEDLIDYGKIEDTKYLLFLHLSVLSFLIIPLGNILIPLILWLIKRERIIDLNKQGANLLNFQIFWTFLFFASFMSYAFIKIRHLPNGLIPLYISISLLVINVIYPTIISFMIAKRRIRKYYFPIIRFIKI